MPLLHQMSSQWDTRGHVPAPPGASRDRRCPSVPEARVSAFPLTLARAAQPLCHLLRSLREQDLPQLPFALAKQASFQRHRISGTLNIAGDLGLLNYPKE